MATPLGPAGAPPGRANRPLPRMDAASGGSPGGHASATPRAGRSAWVGPLSVTFADDARHSRRDAPRLAPADSSPPQSRRRRWAAAGARAAGHGDTGAQRGTVDLACANRDVLAAAAAQGGAGREWSPAAHRSWAGRHGGGSLGLAGSVLAAAAAAAAASAAAAAAAAPSATATERADGFPTAPTGQAAAGEGPKARPPIMRRQRSLSDSAGATGHPVSRPRWGPARPVASALSLATSPASEAVRVRAPKRARQLADDASYRSRSSRGGSHEAVPAGQRMRRAPGDEAGDGTAPEVTGPRHGGLPQPHLGDIPEAGQQARSQPAPSDAGSDLAVAGGEAPGLESGAGASRRQVQRGLEQHLQRSSPALQLGPAGPHRPGVSALASDGAGTPAWTESSAWTPHQHGHPVELRSTGPPPAGAPRVGAAASGWAELASGRLQTSLAPTAPSSVGRSQAPRSAAASSRGPRSVASASRLSLAMSSGWGNPRPSLLPEPPLLPGAHQPGGALRSHGPLTLLSSLTRGDGSVALSRVASASALHKGHTSLSVRPDSAADRRHERATADSDSHVVGGPVSLAATPASAGSLGRGLLATSAPVSLVPQARAASNAVATGPGNAWDAPRRAPRRRGTSVGASAAAPPEHWWSPRLDASAIAARQVPRPRAGQHVHFAHDVPPSPADPGPSVPPDPPAFDTLLQRELPRSQATAPQPQSLLLAQVERAKRAVSQLRGLLAEAASRDISALVPAAAEHPEGVILATAAWADHVWALRPMQQAIVEMAPGP